MPVVGLPQGYLSCGGGGGAAATATVIPATNKQNKQASKSYMTEVKPKPPRSITNQLKYICILAGLGCSSGKQKIEYESMIVCLQILGSLPRPIFVISDFFETM